MSQFESLSGFSGDKTEGGGGGVTVTGTNPQVQQPVDKKKIMANFRKTGGFGAKK